MAAPIEAGWAAIVDVIWPEMSPLNRRLLAEGIEDFAFDGDSARLTTRTPAARQIAHLHRDFLAEGLSRRAGRPVELRVEPALLAEEAARLGR